MKDLKDKSVVIVIPVLNEDQFIERCLNSVLSQDYDHNSVFIVVVDNGSTDNTYKIVKKYSVDFPGRVYLLQKTNCTISALRNHGANFMRSDYVAFLDGDSVAPCNWLSKGVGLLIKTHAACVGFAVGYPEKNSHWVERVLFGLGNSSRFSGTMEVDWLCSFNLIVRRKTFDEISGFNEELSTGEDFDFSSRIKKKSKIIFSDLVRVNHLDVPANAIQIFRKEFWRGRGGIRRLFASSSFKRELLSVLVPVFYVFICVLSFFFLFFNSRLFFFFLAFVLIIPFLIVCRKKMGVRDVMAGWYYFSIYLIARGIAAFL